MLIFNRTQAVTQAHLCHLDPWQTGYVESFFSPTVPIQVLSKQEVAQNVLEYYVHHKEQLQQGLQSYDEVQGKGFICWRFLHVGHPSRQGL